ncbi:MAG: FAD-dependent oxidoreductase, partial [Thermomicrobia bacterium]|nr:FAD-dependent oxidoreductase [Thermomicrobia bacterium]
AYIACASYPAHFADGTSWQRRGEGEAHRLLDAVEERAPGFKDGVTGLAWRHAEDWEAEIGLLDGHPMHLDLTLDQLGAFRPLGQLASHRTPIAGLYLTGAGTYPTGGVSAVPGRVAARVLLRDRRKRR